MDADPDAVLPACELAFAYLRERNRDEEAEQWRRRGEERIAELERADAERNRLLKNDELVPHDLSPEALEELRSGLARYPEVERAYVARKVVENAPEHPFYAIGIVPHGGVLRFRRANASAELIQRLISELQLPFDAFFLPLDGDNKPFRKKFRTVEGAEVYSRTSG